MYYENVKESSCGTPKGTVFLYSTVACTFKVFAFISAQTCNLGLLLFD